MSARPIRQVAYFVPDICAAARQHARQFGSGPYFIVNNIPLRKVLHRGRAAALDHSSAYGQWGELMIEFVQQNNSGPSAFHDLYPEGSGRGGLHHVALIVHDLNAARREFADAGYDEALYAEMNDGFPFIMVDALARHGHMIELYPGVPSLVGFYAMVRKAAADFTGGDPLRQFQFA